ncbi:MAG: 1,4-alpha-glucan branching protein GlgB [Oscillospiraceae bacterium]|nr:1,4-alpha-glucan branching protein GlgB [Oscillospiraceae bacterium]
MDLQHFYDGIAFDAYTYFGAHLTHTGTTFCTYAPRAQSVCVMGDFNHWQPQEMPQIAQSGVFQLAVNGAKAGQLYKYAITGPDGTVTQHCDPYGFGMELRPNSASRIVDHSAFAFTDDKWLAARDKNYNRPLNIYELHLGSWRTKADATPESDPVWYTYDEIADELIAYVKQQGYTHIEFLPLAEHPADCSWGYQTSGFFAPTARYGAPQQLMALVNRCHSAGVGVIMDFVPVHFALDAYGLRQYDGTPLYEYPHPDVGESEWGTCNFIYSRREVCSFLQSCANYWLSVFHFDGLRMDAISRAIYWQGDPNRGENLDALQFLRTMNSGLHALHPTAMLIAEDSTAYPKVTAPVQYDGLGFDYKWDLGFMNDTLDFFKLPPQQRPAHYHKLTFSMHYFYNELFLLPFSHDEVVHGKATIIQKMWGLYGDKFAQARALYLYMYAHPGKKLNFMGTELAQFREWDESRSQDWPLLAYPIHDAFHRYMAQLCHLYGTLPALYADEYDPAAFCWLEADACEACVYVFTRSAMGQTVLAAFNFSGAPQAYALQTPLSLSPLLHSDWQPFGGNTPVPPSCGSAFAAPDILLAGAPVLTASLTLPPFSGALYLVQK